MATTQDQQPQQQSALSQNLRGFVSGTASGVAKLVVGHPFDTVKVRLQTDAGASRFKGPIHCLAQTIKHDGFKGLYRGATPPLVGWTAIDSVMFAALGAVRRQLLNGEERKLSFTEHAVAGFAAGMAASFVANPVELVKTRLQTNYAGSWENVAQQQQQGLKLGSVQAASTAKLGPITCMKQIYMERGIPGFYRAMTGTLLFRSFVSVYIASYEYFKVLFAEWNLGPSMMQNFLAGGMAANVLWITSFPTDLVKNRMMADESYKTVPQTFRRIYTEEGIRAFYRGFVPCMLRSFPTNGAAFLALELVVKYWPQ